MNSELLLKKSFIFDNGFTLDKPATRGRGNLSECEMKMIRDRWLQVCNRLLYTCDAFVCTWGELAAQNQQRTSMSWDNNLHLHNAGVWICGNRNVVALLDCLFLESDG